MTRTFIGPNGMLYRIWTSVLPLLGWLLAACSSHVLATEPADNDTSTMQLRLKDGSFAVGQVVASELPNTIGWQNANFDQPFAFDVRSIATIGLQTSQAEEAKVLLEGSQFFELADGAMVAGRLVGIDDQWVTIETALLGEVKAARSRVISLVDASYAGALIYSGPRETDRAWNIGQAEGAWSFEGGALVTMRQGVAVAGNVDLPNKAQISLTLSWQGSPDFVLSLGTSPTKSPSATETVPAAARLEVWDKQLALLREVGDLADIELLSELSSTVPRVELTVYLDQLAGIVIVCDANGRPLDRMVLPANDTQVQSGVQLVNHGPSLNLERFEVRAWDGITTIGGTGSGIVMGETNEVMQGSIIGFDAEKKDLLIRTAEGEERRVPLASVRRGDLEPSAASKPDGNAQQSQPPSETEPAAESDAAPQAEPTEQAVDIPAASDAAVAEIPGNQLSNVASNLFDSHDAPGPEATPPATEPVRLELIWTDRTRLTGAWLTSADGKLRFKADEFSEPFTFDPKLIRSIIGTSERFTADVGEHRIGTLKTEQTQLAGYLEETTPEGSLSAMAWHPVNSLTSSAISSQAEGAIIYSPGNKKGKSAQTDQQTGRSDVVVNAAVQLFLGGRPQARRRAAGEVLVVGVNDQAARPAGGEKPTDANDSVGNVKDEREIVFRSGDAINGSVDRIDESGVRFASSETQTSFATHEQMSSAWLNRQRRDIEISPEKLTRLMTVPRSMKKDPPTHLFVSVLGDCLRGRLISLDQQLVTVEVRLEIMELPRDQVAQIIWLHNRDWDDEKKTAANSDPDGDSQDAVNEPQEPSPAASPEEPSFRVHAIKSTDRGLTFVPKTIQAGVLSGSSDLLGECSVALESLNQLLFGRNISDQVREYNEDPWLLSLAQYPRVFLEEEGGGAAAPGSASPMVGEPATDFGLKTLTGDTFRLSDSRDRVVVLDFWASWCGPCIQTMPLVDEVVAEVGLDKVHLVAVNIQEAPTKVQAAVERLGLDATVLLDRDGEVAAAYAANAIPQTVIIDKAGKVTHVFVGGGTRFVQQFRAALESVTAE